MAIDWDAAVLGPVCDVFGEGDPADASSWPTYLPRAGAPFALQGAIFDAAYTQVVQLDDMPSATTKPVLGVRLSLFAKPPGEGDRVRLPSAGKTFVVKIVRPDGHGWAKLELMESGA